MGLFDRWRNRRAPEPDYLTVDEFLREFPEIKPESAGLRVRQYGAGGAIDVYWPRGKDRPWSAWRYAQASPHEVYLADVVYSSHKSLGGSDGR